MEGSHDAGPKRRFRWKLGTLLAVVAILAVVLAAVRPFTIPATVRAARAVLEAYSPETDLDNYRAESVAKTPSGYWQVRFVRVAGTGAPECSAMVSNEAVRQARFRPWWTPAGR